MDFELTDERQMLQDGLRRYPARHGHARGLLAAATESQTASPKRSGMALPKWV